VGLLFSVIVVALADLPVITQEFVDEINSKAVNWKAHMNTGSLVSGATASEIKVLLGVLPGGPKLPRKTYPTSAAPPDTFSSAINWPYCPTISTIRDQSACGSCWAFGAVEAMSDRICIFQKQNVSLSSAAMAFCCDSCGFGCGGGYPSAAWEYWQSNGLVEEGCWPYPFPSCDHHIPNSKNPCPSQEYNNKDCANKCDSKWTGPAWASDMHYGDHVYSLIGENDILNDIYLNGPVETAFTVYEDFLTYKSGVYRHTSGEPVGGHAVKIVGWGVESGDKYWLIANSWNPDWGLNGYFKILRGNDECGIEDEANGGIPK